MRCLFRDRYCAVAVSLVMLSVITRAAAGQVYRWTDAAGITHYSETPPQDKTLDARQVELPEIPPAIDAPEDYYSVINQLRRMQAQRLENEKLVAERKQAEAEARRALAEAEAAAQEPAYQETEPRYYPAYPVYGYHPRHGWRPGKRPAHRPGNLPRRPARGHTSEYPRHRRHTRRSVSF
ncbi:MAG: DUF4124 domain-containing protein [Gammaproteobacteria bacterium]